MAGLLVSVRSAAEAWAACEGGAAVIDVKEPDRGPLGRADESVWRAIRAAVPAAIPVSVALGELREWAFWSPSPLRADGPTRFPLSPRERGAAERPGKDAPAAGPDSGMRPHPAFGHPLPGGEGNDPPAKVTVGQSLRGREEYVGITYRKLGLSGVGPNWADDWAALRHHLGPGPAWVGVIYADWVPAQAPHPDAVLDVALSLGDCAGVLIDTYDKARPSPVDRSWSPRFDRVRDSGRFLALAGGLDARAIARLAPLGPDLFAVRGAACAGDDRRGAIDAGRVALLVRTATALRPTAFEC